MSAPPNNWMEWIAGLGSVDRPGRSSLHGFVLSARLGLWPALLLSSFAYGHLLQYPPMDTLLIAIDLCLAASVTFLFNDVRDVAIDAANQVDRWSIRSRVDILWFAAALAATLLAIAASSLVLTPVAVAGTIITLLLGFAYSVVFKRILLVGNLMAALLAISPGLIMFVDMGASAPGDAGRGIAGTFLVCAFLYLLSREIKFDEHDIVGDRIGRRSTLPMVMGSAGLNVVHAVLVIASLGSLVAAIAVAGRFSPAANAALALLAAAASFSLTAGAYFSHSKERFYKSTRLVLLIMPIAMLVGF